MSKQITNNDLPNNGGVMYEVLVTCTECEGIGCVNMTDSLYEAQETANQAETMILDDEGELHNYIAAVAEVHRKVIYVPPKDEADM